MPEYNPSLKTLHEVHYLKQGDDPMLTITSITLTYRLPVTDADWVAISSLKQAGLAVPLERDALIAAAYCGQIHTHPEVVRALTCAIFG